MERIQLHNKLAQTLLEQKTILIGGIEINLWTGPNSRCIQIQQSWNKIKSYFDLNDCSSSDCGSIVFTGVMQIPRIEAAEYAVKLGFRVHGSVSRNTDFIVIGSENVSPTKIAVALELNDEGANIQFIDEISFLNIVTENLDYIEEVSKKDRTSTLHNVSNENPVFKIDRKEGKKKSNSAIQKTSNKLEGKSIVISGTFEKHSRDELKDLIEQHGGKNVGSVSAKTDFILAGDNMGPAKLEKAEKLGVKIISEDEFLSMIE